MNIKEDIFKKIYLESFLSKNDDKEITSPDPKMESDTGNSIDDLTKENIATIDEDSEDKVENLKNGDKKDIPSDKKEDKKEENKEKEEMEKDIEISIETEGIDDINDNELEEFEDDGWGDAISEKLSYLMDELENFTYEIRNCSRGAYTNCKTKEQLKNYMSNDLVDMITNASEEI